MSVDNVDLKNEHFGDLELHGHFDDFFLGVNQNAPGTSSTTNHKFLCNLGTTSRSMVLTTPYTKTKKKK
jgi:hypothetical protein